MEYTPLYTKEQNNIKKTPMETTYTYEQKVLFTIPLLVCFEIRNKTLSDIRKCPSDFAGTQVRGHSQMT